MRNMKVTGELVNSKGSNELVISIRSSTGSSSYFFFLNSDLIVYQT